MSNARAWALAVSLIAAAACGETEPAAPALANDEGPARAEGGTARDRTTRDAAAASERDAAADSGPIGDSPRPTPRSHDGGVPHDAAVRAEAPAPVREGRPRSGPSSGCGKPVSDAPGKFVPHSIRAGDRDRTYQLFLPESYDAARRYPVVFRFHGRSGNGLSGGLDLQYSAPKDVLIVSPDGLNTTWSAGAPDLALFDALVAEVTERYCVDLGRLFAYGFSAGAGFSELLSCVRGDTLRGVAAIAGYDWGRGKTCEGPVAAWLLHDSMDPSAPIAGGRAARDRLLGQNGCSMQTEPADDGCVRYRECSEGHPVVWCETQGKGHDIRGDYAPNAVWHFFRALP